MPSHSHNLRPMRLQTRSTLSSGRKATNKNAVVPTTRHSYSSLSEEGDFGRSRRMEGRRRRAAALSPRGDAAEVVGSGEERGPLRWTGDTPTLLPCCCTPPRTARTLHIAQIYGLVQKQLVRLPEPSAAARARFAFFAYLSYAGVSIDRKVLCIAAFA